MPLTRMTKEVTDQVFEHMLVDLDTGEEIKSDELDDNALTITITDTTTPSGNPAIEFVLPISEKLVMMLKPTTGMMLQVEQEVNKKHKNCGDFERSLVLLSRIICKIDDREGERCVNFTQLMGFDVEDIMTMNQASQTFFRAITTKAK